MGVEGWHLADDVSAIRRLIPSGVQDMIRLEITQMADADRRILECAAVQGVEFTSSVVAKATGTDAAHTEERLAQLAGAYRFIESAGESDVPGEPVAVRFRFAHVLYQNVLYADIAPTRRASLSLSVAAALIGSRAETALGAATGTALLLESGRDNEGASRYFLLAARRAIAVFAYPEATLLCQRGLENLLLVPESIRRDGRELEFCLIFGLALMVTRGYAAPEVERVHRRSRELCLRLHQRKYLVRVLWGLHTCLVNAGELVPSLRLAEEMEEAASSRNDHEAMIQALHARGTTLAFMGRTAEARVALEEAIRLLDSMKRVSRRSLYILDAGVTCMSMLARVLARMGKQDEALEQARMSQTIADRLEHAPSVAYATFWVGWVHHARGEFSEAAGYLATAFDLSRKYGLPQFLEWSRIVRGSCLCHLGTPVEGIAEMRLSLENQLSMNCLLERPFCLNLLAEALLATGARDEALRCCDEALEISKRTEGRSYEVETREIREWALAELVRTA
jgi:tetratricopeptide (TPR) repeat protein